MSGPRLTYCNECKFGYAGEHTPEDCKLTRAQRSNPCAKCGHGKYWHGEGFCVQAIAGNKDRLPGFCGMCEYKEERP